MSDATPAKIQRDGVFAIQMLKDTFVIAVAVDAAITIVAGLDPLAAILSFVIWMIGIFLGTLLIQAVCNATRETLPRKLVGWVGVSVALAWIVRGFVGGLAWPLAGGVLVYTAIRTILLHRKADLEFRSEQAEKAGNLALAARLADASRAEKEAPQALEGVVNALPADLDPGIRATFDRAVAAHLQIADLLADPGFVVICGALPEAVTRASDDHLADLRRRAGLLHRVQRAAGTDDPSHQEAARAGLALFDARVEQLQAVARAAVQLAATEGPAELERFQDAVERLQGSL